MCKMEGGSHRGTKNGTLEQQNGLNQQFPGGEFLEDQNESILAVAHELALAGDELTRRFSKNDKKEDTLWHNVKRYAFIVTFRALFGLV